MLTRPEWGYEKRSKTVMSMLTRLILFFILFLTSQLGISAMSTFTEYQYDVNHTVLSEGIYDYDTTSNPRYSHLVPLSEKTQDRSFLAFVSDFLATKRIPNGKAFPNRSLPRDKHGNPIPETNAPHTQLGTKTGRKGTYPQAREFDSNGNPVRDIDFTNHGRANHPNPHQHRYIPNETGGTPKRGPTEPLQYP